MALSFYGVFFLARVFFAKAREHQGITTIIAYPLSIIEVFKKLNTYMKVVGGIIFLCKAIFKLGFRSKGISFRSYELVLAMLFTEEEAQQGFATKILYLT